MDLNENIDNLKNLIVQRIEDDYYSGKHLIKGYNPDTETGRIHSDFYLKNNVFIQHRVRTMNKVLTMKFLSVGKVVDTLELDLNKLESAYIVKNRDERLGAFLDGEG